MATRKGLEPSTSSVTGWRTNQLYYRATFVNGNNRARTCDPLLVRQMLSQLSYAPTFAAFCCRFPRAHHRGDKRYNTLYRAFCQYLFSKKNSDFFCAAEPRPTRRESPLPSGAVRAFSALVYREPESQRAGKSGFIAVICAPAVRFYWDVWRLVHAPLCVSIGMSGV